MSVSSSPVQIPQSSGIDGSSLGRGASLAPSNIAASFTDAGWLTTILVLVATLLVLEQSVYRYKKQHIPGNKWTIPVIGKFAGESKLCPLYDFSQTLS